MTGVGDDSRERSATKPWLAVGFLLAIGATLALVLTDDLRWVRLAVVAALWAALIGALMAAKYRRQASASEKSATKAQQIYELELQKEVAARREHELEVEATARERAEAATGDELEALRDELKTLRENLQALFGGEVLWERIALTAQSTRMRKLGEEPRLVASGDANGNGATPARLTVAAETDEGQDRPTELISRIRDLDADPAEDESEEPVVSRAQQPRRREPGTSRTRFVPRPSRPAEESRPAQQPVEPPARRVPPRSGSAMARASEAANRARAEMSRPYQRPVPPPVGGPKSDPPTGSPERGPAPARRSAPPVRPGFPPSRQVPPPASEEAPTRTQPPVDASRAAGAARPEVRRSRSGTPEATRYTEAVPDTGQQPVVPPIPPAPRPLAPAVPPHPAAAQPPPTPSSPPAVPPREAARQTEPATAEPNQTLPAEATEAAHRSGGRRRRDVPTDSESATAATTALPTDAVASASPGGRRYRPDGEEPSWLTASRSGGAEASSGGRRAAPESGSDDEEPAGSHTEGRSVSELLAAYGASGATPRRRRRAAD